MKKVSVIVAIVASALVIGCQDSSQYSPVGNDFAQSSYPVLTRTSSNPDGVFDLKEQFSFGNAESIDNTYELSGQIQYTLVPVDDGMFDFSVVLDGTLAKNGPKPEAGKLYSESISRVPVVAKQEVSVEKSFEVQGFETSLYLHVIFSVSDADVKIDQMWLSGPSPILARVGELK